MHKLRRPRGAVASRRVRTGVLVVEGAVILSILLVVVFALMDLGLAAFRYNALGSASRHIARQAIVRGAEAPSEIQSWGPAPYSGTASDNSEIAAAARMRLATVDVRDVRIEVVWPDGDHRERNRVRVRLQYPHRPFIPFLSVHGPLELQAESTMRIVH